jgi:hypothetical protein
MVLIVTKIQTRAILEGHRTKERNCGIFGRCNGEDPNLGTRYEQVISW